MSHVARYWVVLAVLAGCSSEEPGAASHDAASASTTAADDGLDASSVTSGDTTAQDTVSVAFDSSTTDVIVGTDVVDGSDGDTAIDAATASADGMDASDGSSDSASTATDAADGTDGIDGEVTAGDGLVDASDGADTASTTANDGTDGVDGAEGSTEYSLFIGDWVLAPGEESTRCVEKRLTNEEPILITSITTTLNPGSHHLIVYRLEDGPENPNPYPCAPFAGGVSGTEFPLMISEIPNETLQFPAGVGLELEPKQRIRIEAHYLNYYPENITAHADVTFKVAESDEITDKANLIFYGTTNIGLPPGSEVTGDWKFIDLPNDTSVFAITGHTHQWGTNVEISLSTSKTDPGLSLYPGDTPFVWDEAPIETFSPPISVGSADGFRFRCSWKNLSDSYVGFGPSANDEMCFLWAYYYPDQGFQVSF